MRVSLLALCLGSQVTFPLPGGRPDPSPLPGAPRLPDQSTLQGEVRTKAGEPIPLATVSIASNQDATRADQRGEGVGWPGAVTKVKHDGTFRLLVPGSSTYRVCAEVPSKPKQCRLVDVDANDVEVVVFSF